MARAEGQSRYQTTLFPVVLYEVVGCDDPVRVIDAFFAVLDLELLGFSKAVADMGRPAYAPGDLLKLYIFMGTCAGCERAVGWRQRRSATFR